jgi:transcriptional regulator with XRE-family HTH domain
MENFKERLNRLAQDAPESSWGKKIEQRRATGGLKKSIKIAIKLNMILRQKEMKQKQLAELLGVSAQQVNKILKGRENLTLDTIERIEMVLGVDLITVLREDEKVVKSISGNFADSKFFNSTQALSPEDKEFENYAFSYANDNNALVG